MSEILKIGTVVYAVHKSYVELNVGGKIIPSRIKTYENVDGEVRPVLRVIGEKREVTHAFHNIYENFDDAIDAITTKK